MSSDQASGTHSCPNCSALYKIPPLHETLTPCLLKGKSVCWRLSRPATLCGQRQLALSRSGTSTISFFHLILLFCFTDAIWRSHSVLSWPCFGGWASDLYIVRAACKPFGDPSLWKAFYLWYKPGVSKLRCAYHKPLQSHLCKALAAIAVTCHHVWSWCAVTSVHLPRKSLRRTKPPHPKLFFKPFVFFLDFCSVKYSMKWETWCNHLFLQCISPGSVFFPTSQKFEFLPVLYIG